jgi:CSLREA domain-containing protein/uncharacterized repeat protein (TIGR01451 family)
MLARTISILSTKIILLLGTSLALVAGGVATFVAQSVIVPAPSSPARIKLQTNHKTITFSDATAVTASELESTSAQPLTLATADFDEDGTPDLLGGFSTEARLYRGNVEAIYPNHKTAANAPAFLPATRNLALPSAPDFLVTGDFNNDGHSDFIAATRHHTALYLLTGDGTGNFAPAQTLELNGGVTALAAGEINRADGLADLVVGINTPQGAQILLYEAAQGAWQAQPQTFSLAQAATSIVIGQITRDTLADVAIAAGSELVVLEGSITTPRLTRQMMQFALESVAIGRFTDKARTGASQIAMLARGGSIYITQDNQTLSATASNRSRTGRAVGNRWQPELLLSVGAQTESAAATQLLRANVSTGQRDDLLLLGANKINLVTNQTTPELVAATLENQSDIVTALPLRISSSARAGLVMLSTQQPTPLFAAPEVAMTFTVNSNADANDSNPGDGVCSISPSAPACTLRAAIQEANANAGQDTILFNLPATAQTITLFSTLPPISEAVTIDGTPVAPAPADQSIIIVGSGQITSGDSLFTITSGNTVVRRLTINNNRSLIAIDISGGGNNRIEGNVISNGFEGITIDGSSQNIIGGTTAAARNVIGGNLLEGIGIFGATATNNQIIGNYIGVDTTGTRGNGNGLGIILDLARNTTIGGTTIAARNVISANSREAIYLDGTPALSFLLPEAADGNVIQGNYIGLDAPGINALGNGIDVEVPASAIEIDGASNTIIGGVGANAGNVIANNGDAGVAVLPRSTIPGAELAVNNSILGNSIYNNGGLGIDLEASGISTNDPGDGDIGANNLQNYPILTGALTRSTGTTITGTLNSTANSTFTVEVFNNPSCDPSGNGEGQTFVARATVTTNAAGVANFSISSPTPIQAGRFITATATDASGNTSEFSACRTVQNAIVDLNVAQTVSANPILVGNNLTYNVTVTNSGPDDATGVVLANTITIPNGQFTIVSTTPSQGTCTGSGPINCNLGTIPAASNATVRIIITPTIPLTGTPVNSVTVTNTATASSNEIEALPPNNTTSVSAVVNASADLAITQTVTPNPAASGSVVTYIITITNSGPSTAINAFARFDPPTLLSNMTCTAPAGWSCNRDGNPFFAGASTFAPGTAVFTLRGNLGCLGQNASLTNAVNVSSSTTDTNTANNSASVTIVGQAGAAVGTITYATPTATALAFGPVVAGSSGTPPSGTFTLTNTGCLPMNLTTAQFIRASNTANLSGVDDSRYYSLRLIPASGAEIPLNPTPTADRNAPQPIPISRTLQSGQSLQFRVTFNPPLPFFAGFFAARDQLLFANQVLPDALDSRLVFSFITGSPSLPSVAEAVGDPGSVAANLSARVSPAIQIIPRDGNNVGNPATSPRVIMENVRGDFRVRVSLYDANKNATRITYQFFDTFLQPASNPIAVDIASLISSSALLPGQAFTLQQDFSGAAGRPDIVYVRVTVNDGDGTTVSASSNPLLPALAAPSAQTSLEAIVSDVIKLPGLRLDGSAGAPSRQTDSRRLSTNGQ